MATHGMKVTIGKHVFDPEHMVEIDYTNYRGERRKRLIVPIALKGTPTHVYMRPYFAMTFEETEYHKPAQFIFHALDVAKGEERVFAMQGIHGWRELTDREMWKRLREIADRQIDATIDVTKPAQPETTEQALRRTSYKPRGYFGNSD